MGTLIQGNANGTMNKKSFGLSLIRISRIALLLILIVFIGGCTEKQAGPNKEPLNESETGARDFHEENESSVEQPIPKDNTTELSQSPTS